jgi:hypothetical protein
MTATDIEPVTATDLAVKTTTSDLDHAARLGMWLAAAESGAKDPKALGMAAALRIAYAGSLGLPAHAAGDIYVIKGNLTLSARMERALAHTHGIRVVKLEDTPEHVTAAVLDANGNELGRTKYELAEAVANGLTTGPGSDNWRNRPARMMWARASSRALDDWAPWVVVGVMSAEEAQDLSLMPSQPFDSDEVLTGEVVDDDDR